MVSRACPTLALLAVNMWYARKLMYEEYAAYQSVWLWINASTLLASLGLPKYILTFGDYRQLFSKLSKAVLGFVSLLLVIGAYYISPFRSVFSTTEMIMFVAIIFIQIIILVFEAQLLHAQKNRRLMFSSLLFTILFLVGHITVQQLGFSMTSWLAMMCIIVCFRAITMRVPSTIAPLGNEKPSELKWIASNDALQFLTKWLDKIILAYFLTPKEYSIYFNGTNEIPLTGVLISVFGAAFSVHVLKPKISGFQAAIFRRSASAFSAVLFPLFGLCLFFPQEIITALFGMQYSSASSLFALMALLLPMRIVAYTPLLQHQGLGKIILLGACIDLSLVVILALLLYPTFGLSGVAIAVVAATYCQVAFYLYHILRSYKISLSELFEWRLLGVRLLTVTLVFLGLRTCLKSISNYTSLIVALSVCAPLTAHYILREWRKTASVDKE